MEARARLPQCDVGVMHGSTGLGSPLLPASHRPPTGGYWTPGCARHWPCRYGLQPFLWDVLASGAVLRSTPADDASFISTTNEKGFTASKLAFSARRIPLPSSLCPSGPADTQTYLA